MARCQAVLCSQSHCLQKPLETYFSACRTIGRLESGSFGDLFFKYMDPLGRIQGFRATVQQQSRIQFTLPPIRPLTSKEMVVDQK